MPPPRHPRGHLREQQLATFKLPEELVIIDSLPVNAGGKVDKGALREHALKQLTGHPA